MELECEIEEGGTLHATFSTNNMRDDFDSPRITMTIRILVGFLLGEWMNKWEREPMLTNR